MDYISTKEASEKWGITERRIQILCGQGRIDGVVRFNRVWAIPKVQRNPPMPEKATRTKRIASISK